VEEGLSENTVFCILQDSNGYMWFGTKDGLNRYDGTNFRVYRHIIGDPTSLGNNIVRCVVESENNELYIGTDDGVYIMDKIHETFTFLCCRSSSTERLSSMINTLYIDKEGLIWIGTTAEGVYTYNPESMELEQVETITPEYTCNTIWKIYGDSSGTIWLATRSGLMRYNRIINKLEPVPSLYDNALLQYETLTIHEDPKGNLWLGTWTEGIRFFNKQRYEDISYFGSDTKLHISHIRVISQYTDQSLLIGSDDGLYIFDIETKEVERIDIPKSEHSISDQNIYSMATDREGSIWIGTYFGGVNYVNQSLIPIETYHTGLGKGMLSGKAVSQFCEDPSGNMWIATEDGGINYFDVKTKTFSQPIATSYHNIHALMLDGENLWIGTFSRGLDVYNIRTKKITNYRHDIYNRHSLDRNDIFALYKTSKGDIYLGTPEGLNMYQPLTDNFLRIEEVKGYIHDIIEDDFGNLWVATWGKGVKRLPANSDTWIHYDEIKESSDPIVNSYLNGFHIDNQKRLILFSEGRGIFIYNYQTDDFTQISETNGLLNNVVYGVLDDPSGKLWMSCNKGIVCFHLDNPQDYKLFANEEGAQSNQFNYKSYYKARDGKFYFGGVNGFNCFYPRELDKIMNELIPPVEITQMHFLGEISPEKEKEVQTQLNKKSKIVLPYDKSSFTISYISLSYLSQSKNQYAYKLEGADNEWNYVGNKKEVTYVNLSPGKYTFKVKASNNNNVWNENGTKIEIEIIPPFWLSLPAKLFYTTFVLIIICILGYYYWRRLKDRELQRLEKYKIEQETLSFKSKIDFFTNIAHEIRTPVSLIKAPLEEIISVNHCDESDRLNLKIIEKNCNRLNVLINQLLDFRRMDSTHYVLNPEKINLKEYIHELYERFRKTPQSKKIEFTLHLPTDDSEMYIITDTDALTKIVGNLLTNAIKYTNNKITLSLKLKMEEYYAITVEDNGKGIPHELKKVIFDPFYRMKEDRNKDGTGIGLSLAMKLARMLQGNIVVTDATGGGSIFNFTFKALPQEKESKQLPINQKERRETHDNDYLNNTIKDKKYVILVVDDNEDITLFIKNNLQNEYQVDEASNAMKAFDLLEEKAYDLIISDIMMPDIDGISFTRKVKSDLNYSHIPIILLSAKTENAIKVDGLRSGAEVFVEKPFSLSFLRAQILSLLENRKTILESFSRSPLASYAMLVTNKSDENFISKLNNEIEKNLSDQTFCVDSLSDILGISRSHLQRKLKGISGVSPGEYLRDYRLRRACQLLIEEDVRINEVADRVGFNSASYFTKAFYKCYKMLPKDFILDAKRAIEDKQ